jgi:hypothetical protein
LFLSSPLVWYSLFLPYKMMMIMNDGDNNDDDNNDDDDNDDDDE